MIDHLDQLKCMPKSIPSRKYKGKNALSTQKQNLLEISNFEIIVRHKVEESRIKMQVFLLEIKQIKNIQSEIGQHLL